ncbi:DUF1559 domain-containing protein [Rhodopirellula sp. MGV]|uniref:DUF1559 family PulG-like putative transporter n=1 Tax=Rhodopirellula sp. MGV TaxID=2023130 RepID=UPI00130461D3|nr:DUF1559 domain-containing protein [Rhodopirellula sp. MGV]
MVYVVADLSDLFGGQPKVVLPSGKPLALQQVLSVIAPNQRVDVHDDCVVVTSPNGQSTPGAATAPPQELVDAIAGNPYAVALTLMPSNAVRQLLPAWRANTKASEKAALDALSQLENLRILSLGLDTSTFGGKATAIMSSETAALEAKEWFANLATDQLGTPLPVTPTSSGNTAELVFENRDHLVDLIAELHQRATKNARQSQRLNDFRQAMLGFHNFHATYNRLPPQAIVDDKGKRLLSWRVALLPYIGETELWSRFHLDEPWDGPNNKPLISEMPKVYAGQLPVEDGKTTMVAPLTPDTAMGRAGESTAFKNILDGLSNTIGIVDATPDNAVVWSKPEDLTVDKQNWRKLIVADGQNRFIATMWDGSVRNLSATLDTDVFFDLLTIDGKEDYDHDLLNEN